MNSKELFGALLLEPKGWIEIDSKTLGFFFVIFLSVLSLQNTAEIHTLLFEATVLN